MGLENVTDTLRGLKQELDREFTRSEAAISEGGEPKLLTITAYRDIVRSLQLIIDAQLALANELNRKVDSVL